jgi:hypothetical protein
VGIEQAIQDLPSPWIDEPQSVTSDWKRSNEKRKRRPAPLFLVY